MEAETTSAEVLKARRVAVALTALDIANGDVAVVLERLLPVIERLTHRMKNDDELDEVMGTARAAVSTRKQAYNEFILALTGRK